jgi:hypothetical protein
MLLTVTDKRIKLEMLEDVMITGGGGFADDHVISNVVRESPVPNSQRGLGPFQYLYVRPSPEVKLMSVIFTVSLKDESYTVTGSFPQRLYPRSPNSDFASAW